MINHPELRNTAEVVGSIVWGIRGTGLYVWLALGTAE